jgi:Zn-dependent protease with chaperone function
MSLPLTSPWDHLLLGALALVPAALTGWWGRSLAPLADDPALAERLVAHRQRVLRAVVVTAVVLGVAGPGDLLWTLPLLLVSRATAAFPLRRVLLGETWTLARYLASGARLYLGLAGFWVLLALAPTLVQRGGGWAAVLVAGALGAWNHGYAAVLLWLLRARPLEEATLTSRFAGVIARSGLVAPRVWRAGPPGAVIANALALPALGRASVLFSETLLERLGAEEVTAVFAHEVGHLEQHTPARLRRLYLTALLLIGMGTGGVPILAAAVPGLGPPLALLWPVLVLVLLAVRARSAQAHEYASDRRAVELCGSAEALVSALVKLHAIARLPRRWQQELERSASHPSLARRIQAIRAASAPADPALAGDVVYLSDEPGVALAFGDDGLHQFWKVPPGDTLSREALQRTAGVVRSVRYEQLAELRVAARAGGAPELVVVERDGERRRVRLRAQDLEGLQRTLDRVDPLLPAPPPGQGATRPLARIAALVGALAALAGGPLWSVLLVTLLAAWRPVARLLLAAAAAALAATLLVLHRQAGGPEQHLTLAAGAALLAGVALWVRRRDGNGTDWPDQRLPGWLPGALAVLAVATWALPLGLAQGSLLRLTQTFGAAVGASALPLAAAALIAQSKRRRWRWTAVPLALAACAPVVIGTPWFRAQFVRDPLLAPSPALAVAHPALTELARFEVGPWASQPRVSPGGLRVAVTEGDLDPESESPAAFQVYGGGADPREVEAADVQFLDDARLVTLTPDAGGLTVALHALQGDPPAPWQVRLSGLHAGRLALAPETGQWRVLGEARDGRLVRFEGRVAEASLERTEWPVPPGASRWTLQGLAGSGAIALWLSEEPGSPRPGWAGPLLASLAGFWPVRSSLYAAGASEVALLAVSEADLTCLEPPVGAHEALCLASDGETTHVLAAAGQERRTRGLATVRGRLWPKALASGGIVVGSWNGAPALLDLPARRLLHLRLAGGCGATEAAYGSGLVTLVSPGAERSTVTLYRLGEGAPGALRTDASIAGQDGARGTTPGLAGGATL